MIMIISTTCSVARGSRSGGSAPSAAMSAWKSAVVRAVIEADRLAALQRAGVDLVVDVGDVPHIGHVRVQPPQQPREHVIDDHRPGIAEMREVVDRRPADIHAHMLGIDRREPLLAARQAVVKKKLRHVRPLTAAAFSGKAACLATANG